MNITVTLRCNQGLPVYANHEHVCLLRHSLQHSDELVYLLQHVHIGPNSSGSSIVDGAIPDRTSRPEMLWEGLSLAGTQVK